MDKGNKFTIVTLLIVVLLVTTVIHFFDVSNIHANVYPGFKPQLQEHTRFAVNDSTTKIVHECLSTVNDSTTVPVQGCLSSVNECMEAIRKKIGKPIEAYPHAVEIPKTNPATTIKQKYCVSSSGGFQCSEITIL